MTTNALVVGIAGEAGSGKDTVCDYLVERYGFRKIALATPLKQIVEKVFPKFSKESLYGPSPLRNQGHPAYLLSGECPICSRRMTFVDFDTWECRCGFSHGQHLSPRLALQTLGTEWGRRLYADVWVDYLFSEVEKTIRETGGRATKFCISDVRFANEVGRILEKGGYVVRLKRKKDAPPKRNPTMREIFGRLFGTRKRVHASESGLDNLPDSKFLSVVQNDSTLPILFDRIDKAVSPVL